MARHLSVETVMPAPRGAVEAPGSSDAGPSGMQPTLGGRAPRLRERPALLAVVVGAAVIETAIVWILGVPADRGMTSQVSAPLPFGEFHDLRWVLVFHRSWLGLGLETAAALAFRSLLDAFVVRQVWPGPAPPFFRIWRHLIFFCVVASVALLPWAALLFGLAVVPISWLFFAALPPMLVIAALIHHGAASRSWWRDLPPLRSVGLIGLTFAFHTVVAAVTGIAPAPLWLPIAAGAGLFNAWAWTRMVATVGTRRPRHVWFVPVAPAAVAAMLGIALLGTAVGFGVATTHPAARAATVATSHDLGHGLTGPGAGAPTVLVVGGFDTSWQGQLDPPLPGPFNEQRFSYRGLDRRGDPLPYSASDTHKSVQTLVRMMARQVGLLARRSHGPVDIVAESEGSLVAKVYASSAPAGSVRRLVLLSPLDQPARVYYPRAGVQGWGVLSGYTLRAVSALLGEISPVNLPADSPFLRSIVDHAAALRNLMACRIPSVQEVDLEPLADAVSADNPTATSVPTDVFLAFHGGMLEDPAAQRAIASVLRGGQVHPNELLAGIERSIRLATVAWQTPPLPLSFYPAASRAGSGSCQATRSDLRHWIHLDRTAPPSG